MPENDGDALSPLSGEWRPEDADAARGPGRYEELALIGRGGQGRIVTARDRVLRRDVALKVVDGDPGSPEADRLRREARITAALAHPGIVPVHDLGEDDQGRPFFAMRFLQGRTLAEALEQSPPADRLALVAHVRAAAEAVGFAHRRGIVHRDLKPDNILLGAFGETQVLDWGLAKVEDDSDWERVVTRGFRTRAGTILGTVAYMSPEQAAGEPVGPPADVWALGAILYELLSGRRAFAGPSEKETIAQILSGRRTSLSTTAPQALVAIVDRALAQEPSQRFPDANALVEALENAALEATGAAPPPRAQRGAPWALVAVLLLLLGGAMVWGSRGEPVDPDAIQTSPRPQQAALTLLARDALRVEDRVSAERLALRALSLGESPDVRGALARASLLPAPRLAGVVEVPPCEGPQLHQGLGMIFCRGEDAVVAMDLEGNTVWSTPGVVSRIHVDDPGTIAYLRDGARGAWVAVDPRTGVRQRSVEQELTGGIRTRRGTSVRPGSFLFLYNGRSDRVLLSLHPDEDPVPVEDSCTGHGGMEYAVDGLDAMTFLCADGSVLRRTPDGDRLLSGPIDGRDSIVWTGDLSASGELLAYGSVEGDVGLVDLRTGDRILDVALPGGMIHEVSLSPDAQTVLARDVAGVVTVVDVESGARYRLPERARGILIDASGDALTLGQDGRLARWELPGRPALYALRAEGGAVDAHWTSGGLLLGTGTGVLELDPDRHPAGSWPLASLSGLDVQPPPRLDHVAWSRGARYATGHLVGLQELLAEGETRSLLPNAVSTSAFSTGAFLVLGTGMEPAVLRPDGTSAPLPFQAGDALSYPVFASTRDQSRLFVLSGQGSGALLQFDAEDPLAPQSLPAFPGCRRVAASPEGEELFCLGKDGRIARRAPDATDAAPFADVVNASVIALSPSGELLAVGTLDGSLQLLSVTTGEVVLEGRAHGSRRVSVLGFSPDGATLVTGGWDWRFQFWDLAHLETPFAALSVASEARWAGVPPTERERVALAD